MTYTVKNGDSLSLIAKKFGQPFSSWKQIFDLNPQIGNNPDKIYAGQVLTIPSSWNNASSNPSQEQQTQQVISTPKSDLMNYVYIGGGLFLLYLAYKKRVRK